MVNCAEPVNLSWETIRVAVQAVADACVVGSGIAGVGSLSTSCLVRSPRFGSASVIDHPRGSTCPVVDQHHKLVEYGSRSTNGAKIIGRKQCLQSHTADAIGKFHTNT